MAHQLEALAGQFDPPIDPSEFRIAMGDMPGAVTVVTAWSDDGVPSGATLSAVLSLSLNPPLMLACFDKTSNTLSAIQSQRKFLVHVLAHGQQNIAHQFSSKSAEKFSNVEWGIGALGLPQLEGCVMVAACALHDAVDAGDHMIVIGRVLELERESTLNPIVYARKRMLPFEQEGCQR